MGEKINYMLQRANKSHSEEKIKERIIGLVKAMRKIDVHVPLAGATVVEIGTGWEPICTILLYLMGVKICHTYDHVRHVRFNLAEMLVRIIENQLDEISKISSISLSILEERLSKLKTSTNLDDFLSKANINYHAPADASKTGLEEGSVDLVYSYAVLQAVPEKVIYDLTIESKRILKKSGVAYHVIGLHDPYVGFDKSITRVNFLKYPESLWSFFIKNKISYNNRLREKQYLDIFKECGAKIVWLENKMDPNDIEYLKNMKIDKSFHGMSYEELAVYRTELIISFSSEA
ncbi:MAG: methyltransferase domain-containing protein [Promethearchaeota archaeon]